jgi:CubicO group peptidase (beta-lactamase class C family)
VATVVAYLAQAGQLTLDDSLADRLPELRVGGWAEKSSVRDLLANRSGLPLSSALEFDFDLHRDQDDGALSRLVAEIDPTAAASDFWSYTNLGWCLLGRVVETATGAVWEQAMRRQLLQPAGMSDTTFAIGAPDLRQASGHKVGPEGPVAVGWRQWRAYGPAGTTTVSTVKDLLRFANLQLRDDSLAVLRAPRNENVSIYGWLDSWCHGWAQFDWAGAQVWGWDGVSERPAIVRPLHASARRGRRAANEREYRARAIPQPLCRPHEQAVRGQCAPAPTRGQGRLGRRSLAFRGRLRVAGPAS